jgi:hypothetical protein
MPGSRLILPGCFAGTHKIAQRFGPLIGDPYRREIPGSVTAHQLLGIPSIRLYPITCLHKHQRGCHNLALDAQLRQLPVQNVARRSGFLTGSQPGYRTTLLDQLADRLSAVRNRFQAPHFTFRLRDRYGNRLSSFMTGSFPLVALNCAPFGRS